MGQYYSIVNLSKRERLVWDGGVKLMEFSWIGNYATNTLAKLLKDEWKEDSVIVVGDYAYNSDEYMDILNQIGKKEKIRKKRQEGDDKAYYNFYDRDLYKFKIVKAEKNPEGEDLYLINYDKNLYVDRKNLPVTDFYLSEHGEEIFYRIDPISLLLAVGNGLGMGDFYEKNKGFEYVGIWAGNRVGTSDSIPKGFKEFKPDFVEINNY